MPSRSGPFRSGPFRSWGSSVGTLRSEPFGPNFIRQNEISPKQFLCRQNFKRKETKKQSLGISFCLTDYFIFDFENLWSCTVAYVNNTQ